MLKNFDVARCTTFPFRVSAKYPWALSTWCGVDTLTLLPPINSMSKPTNVCFFTVVRDTFPKKFNLVSNHWVDIVIHVWDLVFVKNHPMVYWCSSINLIAMHFSYGISLNPKSDSVVEKNHSIEGQSLSFHISPSRSAHTLPFWPSRIS